MTTLSYADYLRDLAAPLPPPEAPETRKALALALSILARINLPSKRKETTCQK